MKIKITVDSKIHFQFDELKKRYPKLFASIKERFSYHNPIFRRNKNLNLPTWGIPETIKTFKINGNRIYLFRGSFGWIRKQFKHHEIKIEIADHRLVLPEVDFKCSLVMRGDQEPAVEAMVMKQQGLVIGQCSSGKTCVALRAIAELKQPALVIVHETNLQKQWISEIEKFYGIKKSDVGGVGGLFNKPKLGKINICTQQSIHKEKFISFFANKVGTVVCDECQKAGSRTFQEALHNFPAKNRFGVSANEKRSDKLEFLIYDSIGKTIHTIPDSESGSRKKAKIIFVTTQYKNSQYELTSQRPVLLNEMAKDNERNNLIIKRIKHRLDQGRLVFTFVERRWQALYLGFYIQSLGYRVGFLLGKGGKLEDDYPQEWIDFLKKYDGDKEFWRLKTEGERREIDFIVATQKGDVGISIRTIDVGIITTPAGGNFERFNQQMGRIERDYDDELKIRYGEKRTPILEYFYDDKIQNIKITGNRLMKTFNVSKII